MGRWGIIYMVWNTYLFYLVQDYKICYKILYKKNVNKRMFEYIMNLIEKFGTQRTTVYV